LETDKLEKSAACILIYSILTFYFNINSAQMWSWQCRWSIL